MSVGEGWWSSTSGLTASEVSRLEELKQKVTAGKALTLGKGLPHWSPADAEAPPDVRTITAATLREALIDPTLRDRGNPKGLTLSGAIITGDLEAALIEIPFPVTLHDCVCTGSLDFVAATVPRLFIDGCRVFGVVQVRGTQVGMLILTGTHVLGEERGTACLPADWRPTPSTCQCGKAMRYLRHRGA